MPERKSASEGCKFGDIYGGHIFPHLLLGDPEQQFLRAGHTAEYATPMVIPDEGSRRTGPGPGTLPYLPPAISRSIPGCAPRTCRFPPDRVNLEARYDFPGTATNGKGRIFV